jgi:hypothetical protein
VVEVDLVARDLQVVVLLEAAALVDHVVVLVEVVGQIYPPSLT